jgi:hypothetical protein
VNVKHLASVVAIGALATTSLVGCASSKGSNDAKAGDEKAKANGIACEQAGDLNATPELTPPSDVPMLEGSKVYLSKGPFGKTELYFAALDADPADLNTPRDQAAELLVKAGYTLQRSDQEEGSEAEAHLTGPHDVDIQVIQLCTGKVRLKYKIS